MQGQVSVVVRARDEAGRIGRCLELVGAQRLDGPPAQLIVVDNGSHDATAEIARKYRAEVVSIPRDSFSFGRALNLGAACGSGAILVALSADAFLTDPGWLTRALSCFSDPQVACASGDGYDPGGLPLDRAVTQDLSLAQTHPEWGYSNGAGAFRAELWRQRPFREDLPGCEDKEWAWHWLGQGYRCVIDPQLSPEHDHTHDSLLRIYRRARRESEGLASFQRADAHPLLAEWWSDTRYYSSPLRARLSHRRAARLLGAHAGRRRARAHV
jgi:glycosyltransferase involved in cell wall biosynthesis